MSSMAGTVDQDRVDEWRRTVAGMPGKVKPRESPEAFKFKTYGPSPPEKCALCRARPRLPGHESCGSCFHKMYHQPTCGCPWDPAGDDA